MEEEKAKPSETNTGDAETQVASLAEKLASPKPEGVKDGEQQDTDTALQFVNEALNRDFSTREEAQKSLENLKSMVGDNALAEIREKAAETDDLQKIVRAFATEEGLSYAKAKAELLDQIKDSVPAVANGNGIQSPPGSGDTVLTKRLADLEYQMQTRELSEKFPESVNVINEVKALASTTGKSLMETYMGSNLEKVAKSSAEFQREKTEAQSTSPKTSSRQGTNDASELQALAADVRKLGTSASQQAFVKKALGL